MTVLHHERFRPSDLLASWERAPIGCCWKGWINRLATKVIFNRDEAHIAETSARGPSSATRGVDALTGLNRRREMGFMGTAPAASYICLGNDTPGHARRVCSPRAQILLAASRTSHPRCSRPHATRGPSPWAWILLHRPVARRRQIIASRQLPPRFGRFHLLLVMYTMDMEPLSSRRLLLSAEHGAATSTPGATALYLPADSS